MDQSTASAALKAVRRQDYESAIRLAAQIAREPAAVGMTVYEIAAVAREIATLALAARKAVEAGRNPERYVARVAEILAPFDARVVDSRDVSGMVLGVRWHSCTYTSGFGNIFFVT